MKRSIYKAPFYNTYISETKNNYSNSPFNISLFFN